MPGQNKKNVREIVFYICKENFFIVAKNFFYSREEFAFCICKEIFLQLRRNFFYSCEEIFL